MSSSSSARAATVDARSGLRRQWFVHRLLADSAEEWNLPPEMIVVMCSVPLILALAVPGMALIDKRVFIWFTAEDSFAEYLQVVFCSFAFVLSLATERG